MHPDLMKALEMVTKHAGAAHAEKMFGHLLGTPTPEKALDESTKEEILNHNLATGEKVMHLEPDGDEDQYGNEMPGDEGSQPQGPGDEHMPDKPMHLGIATTTERMPRIMPGPAKEEPIMPKKGGWPKGKSRK